MKEIKENGMTKSTQTEEKYRNIRPGHSRRWVETYSKSIYEENIANKVLVVNKDGWGKWHE